MVLSAKAILGDFHLLTRMAVAPAEARRIAQNSELHLVETLASEIANGLVNRFPIRTLVVELRKFVLPDARYVSVKTTRRR